MPVRNLHWADQNAGIDYPLDEGASCTADDGVRLPSHIITDLNLRWPRSLGERAFVSAVSVTAALVTVTIQAATDSEDAGDFTPLAVVSVRKPVEIGRVYSLLPQSDGVGGWITFGPGTEDANYSGRFSGPAQSRLCPRAARPYASLPVTGLRSDNAATKLTGVVLLKAEDPLELSKQTLEIDGVLRDCIMVSLVDNTGADGFPVPAGADTASESIFQQFAGPCAGRPESHTCGSPEPIEFVNAVAPDCNGTITFQFTGCARLTHILSWCGVAVDCDLGLADACFPPQIPTSEGLLPSEYTPTNIQPPPPSPPPPPAVGDSESFVSLTLLPFSDCFTYSNEVTLTTALGAWAWVADDSATGCGDQLGSASVSYSLPGGQTGFSLSYYSIPGAYASTTAGTRNVAIWDGLDDTTVFRKATTEAKMLDGPTGARHNAQLVLNYRPHDTLAGKYVYFVVEIDYDSQQLSVRRFDGTAFQTLARELLPAISLSRWYKLEATVKAGASPGSTSIVARVSSVEGPSIDTTMAVTTNSYQPSNGRFGIGTNRAISRFAYLKVEEAP